MKKSLLLLLSLTSWAALFSQTSVTGTVTSSSGKPVTGANVYLEGTYDGASTDEQGYFRFETWETGTQTLVVSGLSFETHYETGDIQYFTDIRIVLREAINELTGVTLTAGTFEAGDNSKVSVLKPLDIVTTAGVAGNFVAALQTLPGTTAVNEDGRLFVRGGSAEETQVFIDGLRVFQPFNATANNVPTRGRFSPFLFKGITFSTGGYSAEYGQALSSVLLLNTNDVPAQEQTDISVMSVGGGVGHTEIWGDASLSLNTQYINLAPYEGLIPSTQGVRWREPYESLAGESVFRWKNERGLFKFYTGFNRATLDIEQEDINFEDFVPFALRNSNLYLNASYRHFFENDWTWYAGTSYSMDNNLINLVFGDVDSRENAMHIKTKIKKGFSNRFSLQAGVELFDTDYDEEFVIPEGNRFDNEFRDHLYAGFLEADIYFSNRFAIKLGGRAEYTSVLDRSALSPRVSLAYKNGEHGQFSLAYGDFYQNPSRDVLKFGADIEWERTRHYIANYQYVNQGRTFRAEGYYKDYSGLLRFDTAFPEFDSRYDNLGSGHAAGLDIFWRDNSSIENLDYWVSYSYLDTQREFRNFPVAGTPNFAPRHNFSLVTKYWVDSLRSQIGLSYNYHSGRYYTNPNRPGFQNELTPDFNNLSINWSYLIDQQKILYFSVNNVLGLRNINNFQYSDTPDPLGNFDRRAIRPPADTFFFVGFFWTLSEDNKANQLDNL